MLEHPVGGIRLHLEPDEVAVVRAGAVAATEVVAGHEHDSRAAWYSAWL